MSNIPKPENFHLKGAGDFSYPIKIEPGDWMRAEFTDGNGITRVYEKDCAPGSDWVEVKP